MVGQGLGKAQAGKEWTREWDRGYPCFHPAQTTVNQEQEI